VAAGVESVPITHHLPVVWPSVSSSLLGETNSLGISSQFILLGTLSRT
jgi:hypothetical protein